MICAFLRLCSEASAAARACSCHVRSCYVRCALLQCNSLALAWGAELMGLPRLLPSAARVEWLCTRLLTYCEVRCELRLPACPTRWQAWRACMHAYMHLWGGRLPLLVAGCTAGLTPQA